MIAAIVAVFLVLAFVGACPCIHSARISERERRDRWQ